MLQPLRLVAWAGVQVALEKARWKRTAPGVGGGPRFAVALPLAALSIACVLNRSSQAVPFNSGIRGDKVVS